MDIEMTSVARIRKLRWCTVWILRHGWRTAHPSLRDSKGQAWIIILESSGVGRRTKSQGSNMNSYVNSLVPPPTMISKTSSEALASPVSGSPLQY